MVAAGLSSAARKSKIRSRLAAPDCNGSKMIKFSCNYSCNNV